MNGKRSVKRYEAMADAERNALDVLAFLFRESREFRSSNRRLQHRILIDLGLFPAQTDYVLGVLDKLRDMFDPNFPGEATLGLCPIGWRPTVLAPVFWGREQAYIGKIRTTIYYPSLDGSPETAPFLADCGKYPLILFLHGHCPQEGDHLAKWERALAQLARSGFVVAAPLLGRIAGGPTQEALLDEVLEVLAWMREQWTGRAALLPPPHMGVFGHSYGAMLAGRVAASQPVRAYASLSAGWHEWRSFGSGLPIPLFELSDPSLHVWGTDAILDVIGDADWERIALPRHRVVLNEGGHWVYLQGTSGGCSPPARRLPASRRSSRRSGGRLLHQIFAARAAGWKLDPDESRTARRAPDL